MERKSLIFLFLYFHLFFYILGALSGRGTKIALVLIQRKEMSPTAVASDENSASERATGQKLLLVFTDFLS